MDMQATISRKDFLKKTALGALGLMLLSKTQIANAAGGAVVVDNLGNAEAVYKGDAAPANTESMWIDTSTNGIPRYYNSGWKAAGGQITELVTLRAASWNGAAAPFKYDLSDKYPDAKYNISIACCNNTTADQQKALSKAQVVGDINHNYIYAQKTKPTIDIQVMVVATPK